MRFLLAACLVLGLVLFVASLADNGTVADIEAVLAGLLCAVAICAFVETQKIRKDTTDAS